MYTKVFLLSAILLLSACSSSQLTYRDDRILIQSGNTSIVNDAQFVSKRSQNFSTLFIDQKILKMPEGNLIVYEDARTDLQYEFGPSLSRIIRIVFDARALVPVYI